MNQVQPYSGSFEDIEKIAEQLKSKFREHVTTKRPVHDFLVGCVEYLGGTVEIENNPAPFEKDGGSLFVQDFRNFIVYLSALTSPLRDNFTIAHELGHYFLHLPPKIETPILLPRYGNSLIESQANRFAAAFLMPRAELREKALEFQKNISLLASHFEVSPSAVNVRMQYAL
jgi:Zn-dependent peptidase ImmA (M78 family)